MPQLSIPVSPLIKFGRWSLLTLGIFYGAYNQKLLSQKEAKHREFETKQKAKRDAKLSDDKKRLAEAEMHAIDILSGKIV